MEQTISQQNEPNNQIEPSIKRSRLHQPSKVPVSNIDYEEYKYVLPSARTIVEYKQLQAAQEERDAGVALFKKNSDTKLTLHFDTTSRNNIDGEWPSLILNFSNTRRYRLRPLFFAYEDRANIIRLIIETYECLAVASAAELSSPVSACLLWEKTDSLMTDAVTKKPFNRSRCI